MYNWYILKVQSRLEDTVASKIRFVLERIGCSACVSEIFIPHEKMQVVRKGKKKETTCKFFPGYLMLKMKEDPIVFRKITNVHGVYGFLGGARPTRMSCKEMEQLISSIKAGEISKDLDVMFTQGQKIIICSGPFKSFNGVIQEVDEEKERLKVLVTVFERSTLIELSYLQVEKVQ